MDQDIVRLIMLVAIFAVGIGGGLLALRGRESPGAQLSLALGSVFAGGIFLGAGLVHLLPDAIEALNEALPTEGFPFGYLIAAVGFLAVLFIEEIVFGKAHEEAEDSVPASGTSAYALVVILSIHSILAGAALGTDDTLSGSLIIFLAIIAHKGAAGFALTLGFRRAGFDRPKTLRLLTVFATMTPLGIVLGSGLERVMHEGYGRLFEGLFDALAAGTFLYVAIVEIIAGEFSERSAVALKFMALCMGLALMALIALWA